MTLEIRHHMRERENNFQDITEDMRKLFFEQYNIFSRNISPFIVYHFFKAKDTDKRR